MDRDAYLGTVLTELPRLEDASVGLTVTSPPYANRYDYARTYASELAWLGHDQAAFPSPRPSGVSAALPEATLLPGSAPSLSLPRPPLSWFTRAAL